MVVALFRYEVSIIWANGIEYEQSTFVGEVHLVVIIDLYGLVSVTLLSSNDQHSSVRELVRKRLSLCRTNTY